MNEPIKSGQFRWLKSRAYPHDGWFPGEISNCATQWCVSVIGNENDMIPIEGFQIGPVIELPDDLKPMGSVIIGANGERGYKIPVVKT